MHGHVPPYAIYMYKNQLTIVEYPAYCTTYDGIRAGLYASEGHYHIQNTNHATATLVYLMMLFGFL